MFINNRTGENLPWETGTLFIAILTQMFCSADWRQMKTKDEFTVRNSCVSIGFPACLCVIFCDLRVFIWYKQLSLLRRKVVLIFESVHEILKCDHSNESY